jgi:hypothetical protein
MGAATLLVVTLVLLGWMQIGPSETSVFALPRPLFGPPPTTPPEVQEALDLRENLRRKLRLELGKVTLQEAMQELAKALEIDIVLDPEGFEEAGVPLDMELDIWLRELRGDQILRITLDPLHLTYVLRDGVVYITSEEKAGEQLITRVYNIRDLIDSPWARKPDPIHDSAATSPGATGQLCGMCGNGLAGYRSTPRLAWEAAADEIVDLMMSSISPDAWIDNGGTGSATVYRGTLVVSQTEEVHRDVELLLHQLRKVEPSRPGDVLLVQ